MGNYDLRVIMIEPLGDGGITHYSFNLINALVHKGVDVSLFTSKKYEFADKNLSFSLYNRMFCFATYVIKKVPVIDKETRGSSFVRRLLKVFEYPLNTLQAVCLALSEKVKLVHLQSVNITELIMIMAFRMVNLKVIYTIHNVMPRHKKLRFYHIMFYRIIYALCHKIIIHSKQGKQEVVELYKVNKNKIHVIPHGDYKFFVPNIELPKEEAKRSLNISSKCKTILFFGSIRESKGLDKILLAMPMIIEKVPRVRLLVVGEPWENYDKYKKIILENNIQENVFEKLDYVANDDVSKFFFASDLVVLPYRGITQSGVLQIAYAFGKPVVATDLPGFREALVEGKNGYLVRMDDLNMLSKKVVEILCDDEKIDKMGEFSRHLSISEYGWDKIAQNTIDVYNSLA